MTAPLRLRLDSAALISNWRHMAKLSGTAACGAAIKANGYGLGSRGVAERLAEAGCRDFFVATWAEAEALADLALNVSVLHGLRAEDPLDATYARPVLATPEQVRRWKPTGKPCDVMVDTGMNRLGVSAAEIGAGLLDGLVIETLLSHLVSADEDVPLNAKQLAVFGALKGRTQAKRMSLANSAGIALGSDYHFDLTRPGIALYGGWQRSAHDAIRQVATPQAQILQRRLVRAGESVGYNATWIAERDTEVATLNLGYADGYLRCFSSKGLASADGVTLPLIGRVSMDLTALDVTALPGLREGDWVTMSYALPETAALSGLSQYELLTGLGPRYDRIWS